MRPPPDRIASEWARAKRILPAGSAESGPFDPDRAPWVHGITAAIKDARYSSITAILGSQMSKTDGVIINAIGWKLDDDPQPILYIGPTQKNVESISSGRVKKMIESVPSLYEGLEKGKKDKISEKFVNGVRLGFGWANSPTELASHPAAIVFIDERDRMGTSSGTEGDVNILADARTATYDGCTVTVTTPLKGNIDTEIHPETGLEHFKPCDSDGLESPGWSLWQEATRHEWAWPCPDCHEYYIPKFKHLKWPEKSSLKDAFKHAAMACPHCGSLSGEDKKEWMNARGVFVAPGQSVKPWAGEYECAYVTRPGEAAQPVAYGQYLDPSESSDEVSFWVSGLCSPWRSFGQRARTFLKATRSGSPEKIQAAINTGFGECFRVAGDLPEWKDLYRLVDPYKSGEVPDGVKLLTAAVDVQKESLIYTVKGWATGWESWTIESSEIHGDTERDFVWGVLSQLLSKTWDEYLITLMLIDSGYKPGKKNNPTNQIYSFCRRHLGHAYPLKGHAAQDKPYKQSKIDVNHGGRIIKNGLQLWHVDTDYFKSFVYSRLEWPLDQPGRWHLPEDVTEDYLKQITGESRIVKPSGAVSWVRVRANHYLDCEAYNLVAAHIMQVDKLQDSTQPVKVQNGPDSVPQRPAKQRGMRSRGLRR